MHQWWKINTAEAGLELRRVHNKFQLVKLIAHCLLWILIPERELASTQSKDRWKLQTAKHLGSLEGRLTCEPGVDAESQKEAESVKQPHLLHRHSCAATTSPPRPRPSPVPSGALLVSCMRNAWPEAVQNERAKTPNLLFFFNCSKICIT